MTLPLTGQLGMSQINTELGRGCCPQISLDTAENGGYVAINNNSAYRPSSANPATISEWRGYNHAAGPSGECYVVSNGAGSYSYTVYWRSTDGVNRNGTLGPYTTYYICSLIYPYESPSANVNVTPCGSSCSSICTGIGCRACPC